MDKRRNWGRGGRGQVQTDGGIRDTNHTIERMVEMKMVAKFRWREWRASRRYFQTFHFLYWDENSRFCVL
jgi:hypothetical protein